MIKLYRRLASQVRTINKFNRIRIAVENCMTPTDLQTLSATPFPDLDQLGADLPVGRSRSKHDYPDDPGDEFAERERVARRERRNTFVDHAQWCEKLANMCAKSGKSAPEPFSKQKLRRNIFFYSNGGDRAGKVLAICFTSAARRMMIPLAPFLQHLDANLVDVLLLCDPSRNGYRQGVNDEQGDIEDLLEQLVPMLDKKAYRGVVAIGTSTGGLPSVLAALYLGLDAVLCIGGNDPNDSRWQDVRGIGATKLLPHYALRHPHALPEVFLLHSADYPRDENSAKGIAAALSGIVPTKIIAYDAGTDTPVGHGVLPPIVDAGRLSSLFNETAFSGFMESKGEDRAFWIGA